MGSRPRARGLAIVTPTSGNHKWGLPPLVGHDGIVNTSSMIHLLCVACLPDAIPPCSASAIAFMVQQESRHAHRVSHGVAIGMGNVDQ
jgi:hypothetical protein